MFAFTTIHNGIKLIVSIHFNRYISFIFITHMIGAECQNFDISRAFRAAFSVFCENWKINKSLRDSNIDSSDSALCVFNLLTHILYLLCSSIISTKNESVWFPPYRKTSITIRKNFKFVFENWRYRRLTHYMQSHAKREDWHIWFAKVFDFIIILWTHWQLMFESQELSTFEQRFACHTEVYFCLRIWIFWVDKSYFFVVTVHKSQM